MITTTITDRIAELLSLFKLPTMAAECVRRFRESGHDDALDVLLETLEAELGGAARSPLRPTYTRVAPAAGEDLRIPR
jgi:hypothetical protein